ncbi:EF-P lysine aminoacylase EpmA [Chelatococcus asaccharovorans]|uniref:Lysyl-tRNA synthetase class 2 n=1 Tax=Chelatococcus asaccharovorans TaxID=28210 RepID=A0A2V3UAA3_9HYPH|nr:EF-P lysine aminoacylase EpmA [Chelatococcus asaccharovorans]MBS7705256.1 EF-P lysine aminoacylase GenX [Chelatococcus asaccharovorans]PXW60340.1 lysyl-tRNA synthetase class 2 [Chelatococcus asaccharovorans]
MPLLPSFPPSPWWSREEHSRRRPALLARQAIIRALREHFSAQDFVEVEAGILQISPGNETHLHAFRTTLVGLDQGDTPLYLHTSPEFACKKLLAAGETRIFDIARVFRNRERSPLHHPEFTMLEWYRAGAGYETLMADCADILALAAQAAAADVFRHRDVSADPHAPPERLSVVEAFARHAGIDLAAVLPGDDPAAARDAFAAAARAAGLRVAEDDGWSDIFSRVISACVEPRLGLGRATILYDYPASEAALARRKPDDPRFAERFELYVCGVELANAFGELTDAEEQRARFVNDMDEKERIYGERYPLDEDFLAALAAMPAASGIALGLDRLVMLAVGARRIEDVLWTPMP